MNSAFSAATLTGALRHAAERGAERGIGIFDGRGRTVDRRTYPEIHRSVILAASRYREIGIGPGDRVLISLPTGWDWIETWLGAMVVGALPAAIAPPGALGSNADYLERIAGILERTGAARLVAGTMLLEEIDDTERDDISARTLTPERFRSIPGDPGFRPHRPEPEDVAFLQFTSGSTGSPRAVMIPHSAVMHNNRASNEAIGAPYDAPAGAWAEGMVAWLPMHHDMGLVGCLFLSINLIHDLWLFQPTTFLARPHRWLEELAAHGTVFAPAPNFGYQLCVERVSGDRLDGVDLSGWRSAMTGAEMVRTETFEKFADLTAGSGFRRSAVCPCYGLAEGTLAVTFDLVGKGIRTRPRPAGGDPGFGLEDVVSVGAPIRDTELRIVAPDGSDLSDGNVGEVMVHGPGVFVGYYNDPEATAEGLRDGWLATGDLGFLHDGELYLTGRVKDLLIIRGYNVMPHELEWHAEAVAGGGGSRRSGAFSIARDAQGEQAVIVVETAEQDPARLADMEIEIRNRIGRAMSLTLADLVFVRRGQIPRTTSGKVQRRELRNSYLDGNLRRTNQGGSDAHG